MNLDAEAGMRRGGVGRFLRGVIKDSKSDSDITRALAEARVTTIYYMLL